jgi:hypothetical protein
LSVAETAEGLVVAAYFMLVSDVAIQLVDYLRGTT